MMNVFNFFFNSGSFFLWVSSLFVMLCMCFVAVSAKFRCAPLRKILKVQIIQFSSFFFASF